MYERNYFGMMMVETGDADAFIAGMYTKYSNTIKVANEVIGIRSGYNHFAAIHIINGKKDFASYPTPLLTVILMKRLWRILPALRPRLCVFSTGSLS